MTISSTTRKAGPFSGTGLQSVFPFSFKVFAASDVLVVQMDASGVEYTLTLGSHYSVTLNTDQDGNPGGAVTLPASLPVGNSLAISSAIPLTQGASIPNNGGFYPKVIEQALDKLTIAAQQAADASSRTLKFPLSDANPDGSLPTSTVRAGKFLAFDAGGRPAAASGTGADAGLRVDLASLVGAALVGWLNNGAHIPVAQALDMMYYGWADVRNPRFAGGADPSFTPEQNTRAIQAAIDACPFVHFPGNGVYVVAPDMARTNQDNAVGICIDVKTGCTLDLGQATIQQKAGTSCASIIGNSTILSNVVIQGGIVDGNRANVTGSACAVVLFHATDCVIRNVTAKEVGLIGVGFRNINTGYGRNVVTECKVYGSNYIGIQCRYQELGVEITNNIVEGTNDNAIDVEGSGGSSGIGQRILVSGNRCYSFRQGIFMESVGNCIITNNYLQNFGLSGITLNTINANTGLGMAVVTNNQIRDGVGQIGVWVRNTSGFVIIENNLFASLAYSIQCIQGGKYVTIGTNQHTGISKCLISLDKEANALVWSRIQKQDYAGNRDTGNGAPFTLSPIFNPFNYPNRAFRVDATPAYFMMDGVTSASLEGEYQDGLTPPITQNPAWANAYTVYSNTYNAAYETLIYVGSGTLIPGRYVKINGVLFKVSASRAAGVYAIQGAGGNDGNYTANANGAYPAVEYFAEWQEA